MIRILIVDDSPTEIAIIKQILSAADDFEIVGIAHNGKEAIELTARLRPDLITMDIQMPIMDGLQATRIIMDQYPTPIVIISATISDESVSATFPILEAGALTAITKPDNIFASNFTERKQYIIDTLRSLAEIQLIKIPGRPVSKATMAADIVKAGTHCEIVALGASVGGPSAVKYLLSNLPSDFPVPIVIVQHMSKGFTQGYARWLAQCSKLQVVVATDHVSLCKGTVYIAPEEYQLGLKRVNQNLCTRLIPCEGSEDFCPSIDYLLNTVSLEAGSNSIGILLTGMSDDGAEGLLKIREAGGHTLIQDSDSAVVFGMGEVAQSLNAVDKVVPLKDLPFYLITYCINPKFRDENGKN